MSENDMMLPQQLQPLNPTQTQNNLSPVVSRMVSEQTGIQQGESTKNKLSEIERKKQRGKKMVKGIFKFHEVPGGMLEFSVKVNKEDQVVNYRMYDGHVYEIPLAVAIHLNKECAYDEYSYIRGEESNGIYGMRYAGVPAAGFHNFHTQVVTRRVHRTSFQSLEYYDIEELAPQTNLARVENIGITQGYQPQPLLPG